MQGRYGKCNAYCNLGRRRAPSSRLGVLSASRSPTFLLCKYVTRVWQLPVNVSVSTLLDNIDETSLENIATNVVGSRVVEVENLYHSFCVTPTQFHPPPSVPSPPPTPPPTQMALACPGGQRTNGDDCVACRPGYWCQGGFETRCPPGTWNNRTDAMNETDCPTCPAEPAASCLAGYMIYVNPGFFVHAPTDSAGYACAVREACLGGPFFFGELTCEEGYEGLLCGKCSKGFYRNQRRCSSCDLVGIAVAAKDAEEGGLGAEGEVTGGSGSGSGSASANTVSLFISVGVFVIGSLFLYLLPSSFILNLQKTRSGRLWSRAARSHAAQYASRRIRRAAPVFSGLAKVLLSYTQCISALNRFPLVKWPDLFIEFMESMNILVPEFF